MFKKITFITVLLALVTTGCAVDRSALATPEALRNLDPAPDIVTTNFCSDISPDAGETTVATESMEFTEAEFVIEPDTKDYYACVVTSKGIIELTLFDDNAPDTVNNFVFLAREGFYDGVPFHRVVDDFVIQGGDRNGGIAGSPGTSGPGYAWADEASALALPHRAPGMLSMANAGPNTNGSQFFITHTETPHLNGRHAVFGQTSGANAMDVVLSVEQGDLLQTVTIIEVDES